MSDLTQLPDWIQSAMQIGGGAVGSFLLMRRRFSTDTAAIARDKAESNFIATIMLERDSAMTQAREAWAQRTADAKTIARFEALLEAGEKETLRLRQELFDMRIHTRKLTAIVCRLDPQAANVLQLDANGDGVDHPKLGGIGESRPA